MSLTLDHHISNNLFLQNLNPTQKDLEHYLFLKNTGSDNFKEGCKEFTNLLHKTMENYRSLHFSCLIDFLIQNNIDIQFNMEIYSMFSYILRELLQLPEEDIYKPSLDGVSPANDIQNFFKYLFHPNRFFIKNNSFQFDSTVKSIIDYLYDAIEHDNTKLAISIFSEPNTLQYFYDYKKGFLISIKHIKEFSSIRGKFNFDKF